MLLFGALPLAIILLLFITPTAIFYYLKSWQLMTLTYSLISLPMMLLLESLSISLFGTTPGKAFFGIQVLRTDSSKLSFPHACKRSLHLYLYGLMMQLPYLSFFASLSSYHYLCRNNITLWDKAGDIAYCHRPISGFRELMGALICIALSWFFFVLPVYLFR